MFSSHFLVNLKSEGKEDDFLKRSEVKQRGLFSPFLSCGINFVGEKRGAIFKYLDSKLCVYCKKGCVY